MSVVKVAKDTKVHSSTVLIEWEQKHIFLPLICLSLRKGPAVVYVGWDSVQPVDRKAKSIWVCSTSSPCVLLDCNRVTAAMPIALSRKDTECCLPSTRIASGFLGRLGNTTTMQGRVDPKGSSSSSKRITATLPVYNTFCKAITLQHSPVRSAKRPVLILSESRFRASTIIPVPLWLLWMSSASLKHYCTVTYNNNTYLFTISLSCTFEQWSQFNGNVIRQ